MRTITEVEQWARAHPKRDDGRSWEGWSGSLITHAIDAPRAFAEVMDALLHSDLISQDPTAAPAGAIHWWRTTYGHAGIDLDGGGTRILIADRRVTDRWDRSIGTLPVAVPSESAPYIGWSMDFGGTHILQKENA